LAPTEVKFNFHEEEKEIKKLKKKHRDLSEMEDLLTFHSFVKSNSKGHDASLK
jgi:hypothetical protein